MKPLLSCFHFGIGLIVIGAVVTLGVALALWNVSILSPVLLMAAGSIFAVLGSDER